MLLRVRDLNRHCERSDAIQNPWIATPLTAARDDVFNKETFNAP